MAGIIRVAAVGYGGAFNMGPQHLNAIGAHKGFEPAAVCELDPARRAVAETDFPGIATFATIDDMLKAKAADLAIIITPHNTHADLTLKCLNAGLHVVVEKPMAITGDEVTAMLAAAKKKKVMLSTYHNRRWDGDFCALRKVLSEGIIGRVFRIEAGFNGYRQQGTWWRAYKDISGGAIYDWGAHFTDWILNLVDYEIDTVTGFQVKNPAWHKYTNEDHSEFTIHFQGGCLATLTISNLAMDPRPRWRVLGEKGAIVDEGGNFRLRAWVKGRQWETTFPYEEADHTAYYKNVAEHVTKGKPLVITPESAARVIGVLAAANASVEQDGKPVTPIMR